MNCKKLILNISALLLCSQWAQAQVVKVQVVQEGNAYHLDRGGNPYYIKGAGGHVYLDELKNIGGNSIRTWSLDNAKKYLDEAHKRGLTVMMGLWVQHERHGFDYDDEKAVQKQLEYFTRKVKEIKDHPALLFWGIGNEVDLFYKNIKVWDAIQDIAKMIHEVDPNHPTSTVTAGLDSMEVALIKQKAPDIDIYCVNTYGDLKNAVNNIDKFGWTGPYMITEWGPNGHWEVAKTAWGIPIEQSSTQKAISYEDRYRAIAADSATCLGSYVFLWGQKQETTSSWYGLFSKKGEQTEMLDVLHRFWKGGEPANRCPQITDFGIMQSDVLQKKPVLNSGERYTAKTVFKDMDGDKLKLTWSVVEESTNTKSGGDAESEPPAIPGLIKNKKGYTAEFKAPKKEGAYRLFVYAYDKKGHVAYVNIPFYVKPSSKADGVRLKRRNLDFTYN